MVDKDCALCGQPAKEAGRGLALCPACETWGDEIDRAESQRIAEKKRAAMRRLYRRFFEPYMPYGD